MGTQRTLGGWRALVVGVTLSGLVGCAPATTPHSPVESGAPTTRPDPASAEAVLARLEVKGRAPMTGYDRDRFGQAWLDANRNGCDERNDILARDLEVERVENCRVLNGVLADPYTGRLLDYTYGDGTEVDIDHVVSLGNSWATGSAGWSAAKRAGLATDPLNLLAVDASANRQKGDGDAATWLPPDRGYWCSYVARQIAVKAKYGLWVTAPEAATMSAVLSRCPGQLLPPDPGSPVEVDHALPGAAGAPYENCDQARAAGATPVRVGDPGYGPGLDGDGDGVACE